ncbi:hypothetical protein SAMN02745195_02129 [Thermoanaerobacter uzonensis DSM 18761]|uniref:Uncharacterized protein n=1 Tax=Thermoanaerobacter uzonensis DSM 18761 TaxID=1123369 RepID=A0A1M4ZX55_9THEO|nr:hypothetical protein [Thermoanaerobacter uzonensis]SHF22216.1 hypothetical protein SAMN02745195_02129 [Thermoanaerobacter uzonensis DSM 18761]
MVTEHDFEQLFKELKIYETLWSKDVEKGFLKMYLKEYGIDSLFYKVEENDNIRYYTYYPSSISRNLKKKDTIQSRNALIGEFTEKFVKYLFSRTEIVSEKKLYVVNDVICPELGLTASSPADIVISSKNERVLNKDDIYLIGEIKMSLVWNWSFNPDYNSLTEEGDFTSHTGQPSLLRSDSVLKAIGKAVNIRLYNFEEVIPIVIICNTPLHSSYLEKIDNLFSKYFIHGILSLNPYLKNVHGNYIHNTESGSVVTIENLSHLNDKMFDLIKEKESKKKIIIKAIDGNFREELQREIRYIKNADEAIDIVLKRLGI